MRVFRGITAAATRLERQGRWQDEETSCTVAAVLAAVRARGDAAVRDFSARFDGVVLDDYRVPEQAFAEAERAVAAELKEAVALSAARVRAFYRRQPAEGFLAPEDGGFLGQLVRPLERVALYVPGGTAPLFSTLIMLAVPAQVAGVPELVVVTPPRRDGSVAPEILVTCRLLGLETVLRIGGAQAVAALAYGTETVRRADKIVGPGNRFVVAAKRAVYGDIGVEALPGPTETLVIADEDADPRHVAADLLAQAEHLDAEPVLVTTSERLLACVQAELEKRLAALTPASAEAARRALETRGFAVVVASLAEAVACGNLYAPEHLCLLVRDPWALLAEVKHAGGVFIGEASMEALGDYSAGPSHVMPTGGTARFSSAVNVRDFQKVIPLVNISRKTLREIGPGAARMARAEGLEAHARAIEARLEEG